MANKLCKIMRGCSGSGKSTYVKENFPNADILSTDHYWINEAGEYVFDPAKAGEAHAWNLRRFINYITVLSDEDRDSTVVVDNTNTTVAELAPYAAIAGAYGWDVEIITINTVPSTAAPRNVHKVPTKTVEGQYKNMIFNTKNIPKWWKQKIVDGNFKQE